MFSGMDITERVVLDPAFSYPQGRFQLYDANGPQGGYYTISCDRRNGIGAAGGYAVVKSDVCKITEAQLIVDSTETISGT